MKEDVYWSVLHKLWADLPSSGRILRMLQQAITGERLWHMSAEHLARELPDLPAEYRQCLSQQRGKYDLSKVEAYLVQHDIHMMRYGTEAYPALLYEIHQPPAILYWKGTFTEQSLQLAMVGSRNADRYGIQVAEQMAAALSKANIPVVSGLARGIDSAAHRGALQGPGGTIAVQGCGIDQVYPKENLKLAAEILAHENSCIISEFPIGSKPEAWHFPVRNRIISGLSQGVVIVQAARKSGAYITVETALEQGRDVFAVPGEVTNPLSEGPHQLLQEGARLVTCAEDVLEEYMVLHKEEKQVEEKKKLEEKKKSKSKKQSHQQKAVQETLFTTQSHDMPVLTAQETLVLNLFTAEPLSIEEAAYQSKLPMAELMSILSMLELYGLIEQMIGRKFIRIG